MGQATVSKYSYHHHHQKILNRSFQTRSSSDTYAKYIEICARDRDLNSGKILHAYLIITGILNYSSSTYLSSKLIAFYIQCGQQQQATASEDARKLFDRIPQTNLRRWVVLIGAYSRQGCYQQTLDLFKEMQRQGLKPNQYIAPSILKACANLSDIQTGEKIHGLIIRTSTFYFDAFVNSSLIDMYSKCGQVKQARKVFDRMRDKDLVAWNSMVSGYAQHGYAREAFDLVEKMETIQVLKPNLVTWNALIAGFSQVGDLAMALELFKKMRVHGIEPDTVSWTSVISGLVQNLRNNEAFETFQHMLRAGVQLSSFTISSILPACGTVADSKRGKEIHGYALVIGVEDDIFVSSSLVDMYAKCGFIFEAEKLFKKMRRKNTVTWNSMIFGYANHGFCNEAIELFNQMLEEEVKIDHLSFTAALTACSHAGMVDAGRNVFHLMQETHGIEPRLEHYACMVDLLGRAGVLIEAYNLIKAMPIKPDLFVWGALLGACRNHQNIELAEIATKHLYELEPENAGSRLCMSNLYADAGSWGDAERLKKMMKKRNLRRDLGCSWIEIV